MRVRDTGVVAGLLLVLGVANYSIFNLQQVIDQGRQVLLVLRPVDPRSLIAGDYMELRYDARAFPDKTLQEDMPRRGSIILALDAEGVGRFARLGDDGPLAENEVRLRYTLRLADGSLRFGAESYYFQEGQAEHYAGARYGILQVDASGTSVLVGLADEQRRQLGRNSYSERD